MKNIQNIIAAISLLWIAASCHRGNSISIFSDNDNLRINYSGEIKFNDDETAIKSISPDGYLKYIRNGKKLFAENNPQGEVRYEMDDDGKMIDPGSHDGKMFLMRVISDMIDVGFDAKGRLQRLFKKGGTDAVLNAVDNLKMDYIKGMYLEYMLASDSLSQDQLKAIAKKINLGINNDYDKGRLLQKFPAEYLKDSLTARAWFEAVKSINSDYEKASALVYMARQPITREQLNQVVDVSNTIASDYDKANILKELIFKRTFAEENFDKTLDAVGYINSDFEKTNLLKALIEKEKLSADHFNKLLDAAEHVNSDYDKTNLIKELIETGLPAGAGFDKLLSAVIHAGSDFDKANLMRNLSNKNITSDEQWVAFINATSEISSDNDKSNLLVAIAPELPKTDQVKNAYMKASRTINNGNDLGRAVKALE
jgi:hypothetical protein